MRVRLLLIGNVPIALSAVHSLSPLSPNSQIIRPWGYCSFAIPSVLVFKVSLFLWLFLPPKAHTVSPLPLCPEAPLCCLTEFWVLCCLSFTLGDLEGWHCQWKLSTTGSLHWILTDLSAFDFLSEHKRTWNFSIHLLVYSLSASKRTPKSPRIFCQFTCSLGSSFYHPYNTLEFLDSPTTCSCLANLSSS